MIWGSSAGGEERGQARVDVIGDLFGSAVLRVVVGAGAGEALVGAGHVVRDAREGGARYDRLVGRDLDQIVLRVDAVGLGGRQTGLGADDQRGAARREAQHELVERRRAGRVAIK